MPSEPVYIWSLADLWNFIVHVPFLGFAVILAVAYFVLLVAVATWRP